MLADDIEKQLPDLDDIEWPEPEPLEESDALFDSRRKYFEQMRHYNKRKNEGAP